MMFPVPSSICGAQLVLVFFFLVKTLPILQTLVKKGYELVSGGTENHLVLVNLKNKVRGETLFFCSLLSKGYPCFRTLFTKSSAV